MTDYLEDMMHLLDSLILVVVMRVEEENILQYHRSMGVTSISSFK
jgi:hypothetical protein